MSTTPTPTPTPPPAPKATPAQEPPKEDPLEIAPKAKASPKEILELKPNKAKDATSGPHEQVSGLNYTTWSRPDGSTFIAPSANDETYKAKGFKKGGTEEIPDLVAYLEKQAQKKPT
jgi:hypothetical protein